MFVCVGLPGVEPAELLDVVLWLNCLLDPVISGSVICGGACRGVEGTELGGLGINSIPEVGGGGGGGGKEGRKRKSFK